MAISINPYQSNNYWYERDNSVTSSPTSKASTAQEIQDTKSDKAEPSVVLNLSGKAGKIQEMSEQDIKLLDELQKADTEVRAHEMAHVAVGGQYVTSGAQLEYRKGPDGKRYAVAGEVSIDTSPIAGDPQATAEKMRQVQRAALAPASPSSQDRKVASSAGSLAAEAMSELIMSQATERTERNEEKVFGAMQTDNTISGNIQNDSGIYNNIQRETGISGVTRQAADSYSRISAMPIEPQMSLFSISV